MRVLHVGASLVALALFFWFLLRVLQGSRGPVEDFDPDGMSDGWKADQIRSERWRPRKGSDQ